MIIDPRRPHPDRTLVFCPWSVFGLSPLGGYRPDPADASTVDLPPLKWRQKHEVTTLRELFEHMASNLKRAGIDPRVIAQALSHAATRERPALPKPK